jgi:hypothetical protein
MVERKQQITRGGSDTEKTACGSADASRDADVLVVTTGLEPVTKGL